MGSRKWGEGHALAVSALVVIAGATSADEGTVSLDGTLSFRSADGAHTAAIGGRIQQDWVFVRADDDARDDLGVGSIDGTEMRRLRLAMSGSAYDRIAYKAELDFASGEVTPKDVFASIGVGPSVKVQVGNFYEPMGLDELTSSNTITFAERSLVASLSPSRNPGLMVAGHARKRTVTYWMGLFREDDEDTARDLGTGAYTQTGRVTVLPVHGRDEKRYLHLGVSGSHRRPSGGVREVALRPENHIGDRVLRTGEIPVEREVRLGGEVAGGMGPVALQGEVLVMNLSREEGTAPPGTDDPSFLAAYGQVAWMVTGEHRPFDARKATPGRIRPLRSLHDGGWGALELKARLSVADVGDVAPASDIPGTLDVGGTLTSITVGLNWYLDGHTRVMVDAVQAAVEDGGGAEGTVRSLQTRFQVDF
jgi:phosphate-selective porin OprO/OprP